MIFVGGLVTRYLAGWLFSEGIPDDMFQRIGNDIRLKQRLQELESERLQFLAHYEFKPVSFLLVASPCLGSNPLNGALGKVFANLVHITGMQSLRDVFQTHPQSIIYKLSEPGSPFMAALSKFMSVTLISNRHDMIVSYKSALLLPCKSIRYKNKEGFKIMHHEGFPENHEKLHIEYGFEQGRAFTVEGISQKKCSVTQYHQTITDNMEKNLPNLRKVVFDFGISTFPFKFHMHECAVGKQITCENERLESYQKIHLSSLKAASWLSKQFEIDFTNNIIS
jgi:hypothetical protein